MDGVLRLMTFWFAAAFIVFVTGVVHQVLRQLELEKQRNGVLAREMQHRLANLMTMVSAISRQTLRHAQTLDDGRKTLDGRLVAMARAKEPLEDGHGPTDLQSLMSRVLDPFRSHSLSVSGLPAILDSDVGIGVALVLHELATNAVKYGAWSNSNGIVGIRWQVVQNQCLLTWAERYGPAVTPPEKRGSGSTLMQAAFPPERGKVTLTYATEGMRAEIVMPIAQTSFSAAMGVSRSPKEAAAV